MTRTARMAATLAAVSLLGALSGCSADSLENTDPDGYAACKTFSDSRASTKVDETLNLMLESGAYAYDSTTPAIKDTVQPMFEDDMLAELEEASGQTQENFYLADAEKLYAACTAAGYEVADIENDKT